MTYLKVLLPGVAASILMWLLDKSLISLTPTLRVVSMIGAFVITSGVSLLLLRGKAPVTTSIASRQRIGGDTDVEVVDNSITRPGDIEIASGNRIAGKSKTTIRNLDIK